MEVAKASSLALSQVWKATLAGAIVFTTYEIGRFIKASYELNKALKEQQKLLEDMDEFYGDLSDSLNYQIKTVEELKDLTETQLDDEKERLK